MELKRVDTGGAHCSPRHERSQSSWCCGHSPNSPDEPAPVLPEVSLSVVLNHGLVGKVASSIPRSRHPVQLPHAVCAR